MATVQPKSTYNQIIDDIVFEVNDPRLSALAPRAIQGWILDAERKICELFNVKEYYRLGLNEDVTEYPFQDRPRITAGTTATPMVMTAAAHGLSDGDRINVRDVLGLTTANGYWQVDNVATNTFELFFYADISTADAGATTVTVTTVEDHGFSTSDSIVIAGVVGMTDINGTHTITVTETNEFTIPVVTTQTYTSGGICTKNSVGTGTYTSGGKFWRDDEIPTMFKDFDPIERVVSGYRPATKMVEYDYLVRAKRGALYEWRAFSDLGHGLAAIFVDSGVRTLQFYPAPSTDHNANMYGYIKIDPRQYYTDALTDYLTLPQTFDEAIIFWVKMKVFERLKDFPQRSDMFNMFNQTVKTLRIRNPRHIVQEVDAS